MTLYAEKNPMLLRAEKFTGKITDDLSKLGFISPNSFQENTACPTCGKSLKNHMLKGIGSQYQVVCPDSYVIVDNGGSCQIMSSKNFEQLYRPFLKDVVDVDYEEQGEN